MSLESRTAAISCLREKEDRNTCEGAIEHRFPRCVMAKGVRKNITVPGLLAPALPVRSREFGHKTVSPLVVDLVCYDLRSGAPHTITLAIDRDTQAAQDAVDAELVARYSPGQERTGLLVE